VRFYPEAGRYEFGEIPLGQDESVSLGQANRHFRDLLRARGHPIRYGEFPGGHDYIRWRNTLGNAIVVLVDPPAGRGWHQDDGPGE